MGQHGHKYHIIFRSDTAELAAHTQVSVAADLASSATNIKHLCVSWWHVLTVSAAFSSIAARCMHIAHMLTLQLSARKGGGHSSCGSASVEGCLWRWPPLEAAPADRLWRAAMPGALRGDICIPEVRSQVRGLARSMLRSRCAGAPRASAGCVVQV